MPYYWQSFKINDYNNRKFAVFKEVFKNVFICLNHSWNHDEIKWTNLYENIKISMHLRIKYATAAAAKKKKPLKEQTC